MELIDNPNELLACIKKENIKYLHTGKISPYIFPEKRKKVHEEDIYHLIVRIFAISLDKKGKVKFLIQKRSKNKKSNPNYFTDSASGHVSYKENLDFNHILKEAKKELFEEMGVKPQKIEFHTIREEFEEEFEIGFIFIALIGSNISPNPIEVDVEHSRFYSEEELIQLLDTKSFIPIAKEFWEIFINRDITYLFNEKLISDKKERCALFIGRFQPFHNGHLFTVKKILEENAYLKIGIGSSQESNTKINPFNVEERKGFIIETLKSLKVDLNKISFYEIPDLYNAEKWAKNIFFIVGDFDVLYAPNEWMRNLFIEMKCDIAKPEFYKKKEFNGAYIRELISKNNEKWRDLVPQKVSDLIIKFDGIERIKNLFNY